MSSLPDIHHFQVEKAQNGVPLVTFVKTNLQISGSKAKGLLDKRAVWVNGKRVWMAKHRLKPGDRVEVRQTTSADRRPATLECLYEDDWLIAVNKPPGLISESHKESVEALLRQQRSHPQLRALHRLDRDTSGILLFTKQSQTREAYIDCFRDKSVDKYYDVLLAGRLPEHSPAVTMPIDGKDAYTLFQTENVSQNFCRARCKLLTGRTHQIRKHSASLGCRVLGDKQYVKGPEMTQQEKKVPRQMLHAEHLRLPSPHLNGKVIEIHAPWPNDFRTTAKEFKLL